MPSYTATIDIAAPVENVFDRVADLPSHGEWSADPLRVEPIGDRRYRSTVRAKGKTIEAEISVAEVSRPNRLVFDVADVTGNWRHTFTFTPTGNGTSVRRTIDGKLSGAQLVLFWLVLLPIKKPAVKQSLVKLKALLEAARSTA